MPWRSSYPAYRRKAAGSRMEQSTGGTPPYSHPVRIADLRAGRDTSFVLEPNAEARRAIAQALAIPAVRKLRFAADLSPLGREDWQLQARLGATVVQDCVVTLAPVTTRIDEAVSRTCLAHPPEPPQADEVEMPEDDTVEPLPDTIDLGAVMLEALALALPEYPHAQGVEPLQASFTEPGKAPLTDDDVKPFAGLAALRDKLAKKDE